MVVVASLRDSVTLAARPFVPFVVVVAILRRVDVKLCEMMVEKRRKEDIMRSRPEPRCVKRLARAEKGGIPTYIYLPPLPPVTRPVLIF